LLGIFVGDELKELYNVAARRASSDETPVKRSRYRDDNDDDLLKPEISIKEESHRRRPKNDLVESAGLDDSQVSTSLNHVFSVTDAAVR
jgi:predicted Ser/Thr protein kinase